MSKILEKIVEPSKIMVGSPFLLKVKVDLIQSYALITERKDNIILESEEKLITEGEIYYE